MPAPPAPSPETWRRNLRATVLAVFVVFTAFAFVIPFLPLFVSELGVADPRDAALWAGILIGIAPLLAGGMAPVWGRLAGRYGPKRMMVRALACYVVLLALTSLVTSIGQLLVLRAAVGLFGGVGPMGLAMATALAPREETGRAVGAVQAAQILSAAVGPLLGGILADLVGIRATFLITAGICAVALVVVAIGYVEGPPRGPEHAAGGSGLFTVPGLAGLAAVLFLVNFVGRSFTPILPLLLQTLGVEPTRLASATGVLIACYAVAAAASASALGRAAARVPPHVLLAISLVAGSATVLAMAQAPSYRWLLALAGVLGLASGGGLTLCYTIGGLLVSTAQRPSAFGMLSGSALVGGALAPAVAGLLAGWRLDGIFLVDAALYLGVAVAVAAGAAGRVDARAPPPG